MREFIFKQSFPVSMEAWIAQPKRRNGSYNNPSDGTTILFIVHGCLRQEYSICPSGASALQACSPVVKRIPV